MKSIILEDAEAKKLIEQAKRFPELSAHYSVLFKHQALEKEGVKFFEFRGHPVIKIFLQSIRTSRFEWVANFEQLLAFHKSTQGFKKVINESLQPIDFWHSHSQLEMAKIFRDRGCTVQLDDDLMFSVAGTDSFVEIKTFQDDEEVSRLLDRLQGFISEYDVLIRHGPLTEHQIDLIGNHIESELKKTPPSTIDVRLSNDYPPFAIVEFEKKADGQKNKVQAVLLRDLTVVNDEVNILKIIEKCEKARNQLTAKFPDKPSFILFDLQNSTQELEQLKSFDEFRETLYGTKTMVAFLPNWSVAQYDNFVDKVIVQEKIEALDSELKSKGFPITVKEFLCVDQHIVDGRFVYVTKVHVSDRCILERGLFFESKYSTVNGVIVRSNNESRVYLNPFVDKKRALSENNIITSLKLDGHFVLK